MQNKKSGISASQKKIIIIGVILLALLGTLWAVTNFWKPTGNSDPNAPGNSGGESSEVDLGIEVYTVLPKDILQMDVSVGDENFSFVRKDGKWMFGSDSTVRLLASEVDYLCIELSGVYAKECVEENAPDFAKYGLAEPAATLKIHLKDGTDKTVRVGYKSPDGSAYYFSVDGNPNVYLIYASKAELMMRSATAYRNTSILDVDVNNLARVHVIRNGSTMLDVNKKIIALEDGKTKLEWNMTFPKVLPCNGEAIDENIGGKLSYITVAEFIDRSDSRYSSSGVNNPRAVIQLTDDGGISQTIYVGKQDGGKCYVKADDRVYLISEDSISFIDVPPFLYVSKFVNLEHVDNVFKVEISDGNITHVATISNEENGATTYKLNGTGIVKDVFTRQIYQPTVCLLADDFAAPHNRGKSVYTISCYLKDGTVKKMTFYNYDDRNYSVVTEKGVCDFIVRKKKIDDMFAALGTIVPAKP
ncbi:MAG: DUF4340 domain-containing protein [Clostridia bacterium]|nr:DUF4340 domain-containing protein [Clostridia bacterium]